MRRSFAVTTTTALALAALCGGRVRAQAADKSPTAAAAAVQPATPEKHEFHGTLTAGVQLMDGVTEAKGAKLDGALTRPYSETGQFVARGSVDYSKVVVSDNPRVESVQSNRDLFGVGVDQTFGAHGVSMVRSLYLRDPLHEVFYRFEQMAGVGVRFTDAAKRTTLTVVPGVSLLKEDTYLDTPEGWQEGVGFYQELGVKVDKTWSFQNSFTYRHDLRAGDYSIEADAALTGRVAKAAGLQTQYQYVRESFVPPGVKPFQSTLQIGLQLKF